MGVRYFCDRCEKEFKSEGLGIETYARDALGIKIAYMGIGLLCEKCAKKFNIVKDHLEYEESFFTMTDDEILTLISDSSKKEKAQKESNKNKIKTNGDKIRSMDNKELAKFLNYFHNDETAMDEICHDGLCLDGEDCVGCTLKWLQQPVKEMTE